MMLHASCAARVGAGVLVLGAPGAGKSDLVLRLIARGFRLVADDQVHVQGGVAWPPPALAGLLEVHGLGIFRLPWSPAPLRLAVQLARGDRLPEPERHPALEIPLVRIDGGLASAPERVMLALDAALGRVAQVAGAFA